MTIEAMEDEGFSGYQPSTNDPGVYLLVITIAVGLLLNALLPCFVAFGRYRGKARNVRTQEEESPCVFTKKKKDASKAAKNNPWAAKNHMSHQNIDGKNDEEGAAVEEGFMVRGPPGPRSVQSMSDVSHTIRTLDRPGTHHGGSSPSNEDDDDESAHSIGTSVFNQSLVTGGLKRGRTQRRFRRALEKRVMLYESGVKAQSFFRFDSPSSPSSAALNHHGYPTDRKRLDVDDERSYLSKIDTDEVSLNSVAMDGEREDFISKQFLYVEHDVDITCCGVNAWWKPNWILAYFDKLIALAEWDFEMRRITKLTIPFTVQALCTGLIDIASVAVVGKLLGTKAVSAYVMVDMLVDLTSEIVGGFADACTTLCSQAYGSKQYKQVGQYIQMAMIFFVVFSLPFMYIWSTQTEAAVLWFGFDEETARIGQEFANVYVFAALVEGIAEIVHELLDIIGLENYSTVIGIAEEVLGFVLIFQIAFFWTPELYHIGLIHGGVGLFFMILNLCYISVRGWFKRFREGLFGSFSLLNFKAVRLMLKTSSSLSLGYLLTDGEWEILTLLASFLGPAEVAAWTIVGTIWQAIEDVTEAIGDAAEVRCGFLLGCGKPAHAKVSAYKSLLMGFLGSLLLTSILFILGEDLAIWMTNDKVLQVLIRDLLPLLGVGNIAMTVGTICWTLLGAQGRYRLATTVALGGSWLITLPLASIASAALNLSLQGQTAAIVIGYMISGTVNACILFRSDWDRLSELVIESHESPSFDDEEGDDNSCSSLKSNESGSLEGSLPDKDDTSSAVDYENTESI